MNINKPKKVEIKREGDVYLFIEDGRIFGWKPVEDDPDILQAMDENNKEWVEAWKEAVR